jgi:uncharacterized protein (DUF1684 family)
MKTIKIFFLVVFGLLLVQAVLCSGILSLQEESEEDSFLEAELAWRKQMDERMKSTTSWLSIAGLYWLQEGENSFGTSSSCSIQLPENSSPGQTGVFTLKNGKVLLKAHPDVVLKVNGKVTSRATLKGDDSDRPDLVEIEDLRMWVIKRGNRYAIRLRDLNHLPFLDYSGLDFFPPEVKYKIEADFVPYAEHKKIEVPTMIGTQTEMTVVGFVRFLLDEKEFRLEAFSGSLEDENLFFVFKDETSGHETYEASRFLVAQRLESGKIDLNFNRAYNPPCAYTLYATCPLPPPENHLGIRIEAGEKKYPGNVNH